MSDSAAPDSAAPDDSAELARCIDTIERGYEYLLAYAAQGRQDDAGSEVRATLSAMHAALEGLGARLGAAIEAGSAEAARGAAPFIAAISEDAGKARGAIALALSRKAIGSLLIDNLNASIHLRALLTDVFLTDEALRQR